MKEYGNGLKSSVIEKVNSVFPVAQDLGVLSEIFR